MPNVSMKAMLEAGVHFGHQTRRWNPKMARYIFGERNNIHIIDLQKTVKELKKACAFIKGKAADGATFIFVGTKKQAQDILKSEAERCGVANVSIKWLGGTLTNFSTIRKSVKRLEELETWESDGLFKVLSSKEASRLTKQMNRLRKVLSGIRHLKQLPDIIFIIDPVEEAGAIAEGRKLKIPIVAVCDTNCDPDLIDYPIPGNDDAARAIRLFCGAMADAVLEGRNEANQVPFGPQVSKIDESAFGEAPGAGTEPALGAKPKDPGAPALGTEPEDPEAPAPSQRLGTVGAPEARSEVRREARHDSSAGPKSETPAPGASETLIRGAGQDSGTSGVVPESAVPGEARKADEAPATETKDPVPGDTPPPAGGEAIPDSTELKVQEEESKGFRGRRKTKEE